MKWIIKLIKYVYGEFYLYFNWESPERKEREWEMFKRIIEQEAPKIRQELIDSLCHWHPRSNNRSAIFPRTKV